MHMNLNRGSAGGKPFVEYLPDGVALAGGDAGVVRGQGDAGFVAAQFVGFDSQEIVCVERLIEGRQRVESVGSRWADCQAEIDL